MSKEELFMDESGKVLLARIDERTRILSETVLKMNDEFQKNYVRHEHLDAYKKEMKPVKNGFSALASMIGGTVLLALLAQILTK